MGLIVPEMTLVGSRGSSRFYAKPRKLTDAEVSQQFPNHHPGEIWAFHQRGLDITRASEEENVLALAELMFNKGVEWARDHMYKELGRDYRA